MLDPVNTTLRGQLLDDPNRLNALEATGLLDSSEDPAFDRFTTLVRLTLSCDVSLISLVDSARQFFKSRSGDLAEPFCSLRGTPLSHSFCQYVVNDGQALCISNAREHPRVKDNLAIEELGVVAYLGTPLITEDGFVIGSLCAICGEPKEWSATDLQILETIGRSVMSEIRLRISSKILAKSLHALQRAENERDEVLHAMVHDMRTPVAASITCLELLGDDLPLDAEQKELIDVIRSTSGQLLEMLNGILQVNQLENGLDRQPVDVGLLFRDLFNTIKPLADAAPHEFQVAYPPQLISVLADQSLLYRVLMNLISNAVKFCPPHSRILLTAELQPGACLFRVIDNGPGISDEEKPNVFTKHRHGEGLTPTGLSSFGLGLDFCKRIVEAHGSTLSVTDTPGGGCTFSFAVATAD